MDYKLNLNDDPDRVAISSRASDIDICLYLMELVRLMKQPSLEINTDLFRIYLAATPNYLGNIDQSYMEELTPLHKSTLEKFVRHNIANRKLEILFTASAGIFNVGKNRLKRSLPISEDLARPLSLFVQEIKRRGATSVNTPSFTANAQSLLSGLYTSVMNDFESLVPNELGMVPIDEDDYVTLYNFILNSTIIIGDVNNTPAVYRLLYTFARLHMYWLLSNHNNETSVYQANTQSSLSTKVLLDRHVKTTIGPDVTVMERHGGFNFNHWCMARLMSEEATIKHTIKKYRDYAHLSTNALLALRSHMVVPGLARRAVAKLDNRDTLFLALQHELYNTKGHRVRGGGKYETTTID